MQYLITNITFITFPLQLIICIFHSDFITLIFLFFGCALSRNKKPIFTLSICNSLVHCQHFEAMLKPEILLWKIFWQLWHQPPLQHVEIYNDCNCAFCKKKEWTVNLFGTQDPDTVHVHTSTKMESGCY